MSTLKISRRRRTKIICTIGPAVSSLEELRKLARNGMDIARLNFSHGDHEAFRRIIADLRQIEQETGRPIGVLADIQGPKIRVGKLPSGSMQLVPGEDVWIRSASAGSIEGAKSTIPTTYKDFEKDVNPGNTVLLDDGLMSLRVEEKTPDGLRCLVLDGGELKSGKGINVPEVPFSVHAITEKDYSDILFSLENKVDFIALSFVRTDQEVRHLKEFIEARKHSTQVISKIEKSDAIDNLEAIINASDGILVARGDLAVEVGNERVPILQKKIVRQCNLRGRSVIIATQMLMSMVENPRPSRAEASDVANAILDGTDAVMLSNETAVGKYPVEALKMMERIVEETESEGVGQHVLSHEWQLTDQRERAIGVLQGAVRLASVMDAAALVVLTQSGQSAALLAKCRPENPVYAITGNRQSYRQFTLRWGVEGLLMEDMEKLISETTVFEAIGQRLLALNLCRSGDKIIITAGLPRLELGSTNTIKVHQV